ncbi:MAG: dual specificity protein phosphatase family protein [Parachlamydiaceae bacterium]|nr:dual specificity protein phosphatase family protein [Parachlamydiaceae bacterium]
MLPSLEIQPNPDLYDAFINFNMFHRLQPYTRIQLDQNGYFKPIAGRYSLLPFVQELDSLWKGYESEKLLLDFSNFEKKVSNAALKAFDEGANSNDPKLKKERFHELLLTQRAFKDAFKGGQKNGGMFGLLDTYQFDSIYKRLKESIEIMEVNINTVVEKSYQWAKDGIPQLNEKMNKQSLSYFPEESFADDEWHALMKISKLFRSESPGILKYYGLYSVPIGINQIKVQAVDWKLWNTVFVHANGAKLILASLPLHTDSILVGSRNDAEELKKQGVKAVLSVVEVFENHSPGWMIWPVTPEEWEELKILQLQLPTPDFETINLNNIVRGIEFIRWNLENSRTTCLHCKSGKGRSALMMMCYLIKYQNHTAMSAYDLVRKHRPQAGFSEGSRKWRSLLDFEKLIFKERQGALNA